MEGKGEGTWQSPGFLALVLGWIELLVIEREKSYWWGTSEGDIFRDSKSRVSID